MSDAPLKWHPMGGRDWSSWSTQDGQFCAYVFDLTMNDLGTKLRVHDVRRKDSIATMGLPIVTLEFSHRAWAIEQMTAWVESVRALLPDLPIEQAWTSDELREAHEKRRQVPTRCYMAHVFPLGAADDTMCRCGRITKGLYESYTGRKERTT